MIFVDKEKCIGCGRCALICPVKVLEIDNDEKSKVVRKDFCIHCGHCINICPTDALASDFSESKKGIPYKYLTMPTYEQLRNLMLTRRSIRAYDKKEVKKEAIEELLKMAAQAPTARNAQDVKYLVVGPDKARDLEKLASTYWRPQEEENIGVITREAGFEILLGAPVTIGLYGDKRDDGDVNEALWNCMIAAHTILLAAHGMGLGGCYNGLLIHAYRNDEAVKKFFDMPDDQQIYMFVVIGYPHPDIDYINTIERLKPNIIWK